MDLVDKYRPRTYVGTGEGNALVVSVLLFTAGCPFHEAWDRQQLGPPNSSSRKDYMGRRTASSSKKDPVEKRP